MKFRQTLVNKGEDAYCPVLECRITYMFLTLKRLSINMIAPSMRHLPSVSFCHPVVIEQRNVFSATDAKALLRSLFAARSFANVASKIFAFVALSLSLSRDKPTDSPFSSTIFDTEAELIPAKNSAMLCVAQGDFGSCSVFGLRVTESEISLMPSTEDSASS